ncbi:winged helix DNA-binding domain-containing protein [Paenibacillus aurantius]|uniref:Winged helix DNA-binding domain-containing protein n=1 Tax=Paenibacillus aurantius TaxID=2918900 RepID=A0AA96RHG5_9BACL|nr:winged helix DNA-binding domain-containing protein [Paenibacillus aurantius]WNQ11084.1 winged helix DNA-binding domain-containing protein [Paenibacillus aurantius]
MSRAKPVRPQAHESPSLNRKVMSRRALNRALLARQLLLDRSPLSALEAVEHLAGLQAQSPTAPYYALWARLQNFRHEELSGLIQERKAVRLALMRSTLHLVSAADARELRPWVQAALDRGLKGSQHSRYLEGLEREELAREGRRRVEEEPLSFQELGKRLQDRWPGRDAAALCAAVRTFVPLVQLPPRGLWGRSGQAVHTSAESWLGRPLADVPDPARWILRYLAAFGPASVKDVQAWSGLARLGPEMEKLRPRLSVFLDENGVELFDLPDAPRPEEDTPVPVRFMGEFDNSLLSHADRSRIIGEEERKRVITRNGLVHSTFLVDGFVAGTWRIERAKGKALLTVEPFTPLCSGQREAIESEGRRLLGWAAEEEAPEFLLANPVKE